MVGIYKITSPSSKVYIGQSWDIPKRFNSYNYISKQQRGLFNSFKKYSIKHHRFEVIHELPVDVSQEVMDTYEQLYMDAYRDAGVTLLNCKEAGSTGKLCATTKALIIRALTGRKNSEETIRKRALSITGRLVTEEHKRKSREKMTGRVFSEDHRAKLSEAGLGKKKPKGFGKHLSIRLKGVPKSDDHKKALSESRIRSGAAKGENNPKAKVTAEQVLEIRRKYSEGIRQKQLMVEYKIGNTCVNDIISGRKWQHLLPAKS